MTVTSSEAHQITVVLVLKRHRLVLKLEEATSGSLMDLTHKRMYMALVKTACS